MIWGIICLILLLVIIGLVIWLLVRQSGSCPTKGKLNSECKSIQDCNSGLVCVPLLLGVTGTTGITGTGVCKVAYGGVCSANADCAPGQTCRNGVCTISLGTLGGSCPCDVGYTCVNSICKAIFGHPCTANSDCATGICNGGICTAECGPTGSSCSSYSSCTDSYSSCTDSRNSCSSSPSRYTDSRYTDSRYTDSRYTDSRYTDSRYTDSRNSYPSSPSCSSPSKNSYPSCSSPSRNSYPSSSSCSSPSKYDISFRDCSDSKEDFYSCSDTDCTGTIYSLSSECSRKSISKSCPSSPISCSKTSSPKFSSSKFSPSKTSTDDTKETNFSCSPVKKCHRKNKCDTWGSSSFTSFSSSSERYVKRGVYVTNQQNQDQTLFTSIEQPIIDVAKTDKLYLLLANGNVVANSGSNNTVYVTDKKMLRMVRFGTQIIGINKKGKLYYATKSGTNTWTWNLLVNYPKDAIFINSTNNGANLEVTNCRGKAYLYTYNNDWQNGNVVNNRKTHDLRFYGKDTNVWIDINENKNTGVTNNGTKYKKIKAAGFYTDNNIVAVLTEDTFTHVRIIDNNAYFLFSQDC